jgi:hypothetical protein
MLKYLVKKKLLLFFEYFDNLIFIELYTYSEEPEFVWNAEAFNILFKAKCIF